MYLGNREDNTRDRETRLRNKIPKLSGEKHPMSKLTWKDVENIRDIKGKTQREISEMFNVSRETIKDIISYKTWTQPPTEENDE